MALDQVSTPLHGTTQAPPVRRDLARTMLVVLLLALLIGATFWILRPFLLSAIWAMMIVVATWPLMLSVQARVRRRAWAVTTMSAAMVLILVAPVLLAVRTLAVNVDAITRWIRALPTADLPSAPAWLDKIPLVGAKLAQRWSDIAAGGSGQIKAYLAPYANDAAQWLAGALGGAGAMALEFLLTIIIAAILYANGEGARDAIIRFGRRLAGDRGEGVVVLAGQAIRAVALGVVVTALVQTVLAGVGLAVAGVPLAGLLTGVILILCIAQIGPLLVLIPAVIWLFWNDYNAWGTALAVWSIFVGLMDNVLRPMLIRKGANLPLLLIFAGVIGGLVAVGVIGLFVGPVVLAIGYTLLKQWVDEPMPL